MADETSADDSQSEDSLLSDSNKSQIITGATSILTLLAGSVGPQTDKPQAGGAGTAGPGSSAQTGGSGGAYKVNTPLTPAQIATWAVAGLVVVGFGIWLLKKV